MAKVSEIINGGLKVVYPLVEKPVPKVLQDIAANDFLSLSGYKIQYDAVMKTLGDEPQTSVEYMQKLEVYNLLTWAKESLECRTKCADCFIDPSDQKGLYILTTRERDNEFILDPDLKVRSAICLIATEGPSTYTAIVKHIDVYHSCLVIFLRASKIDLNKIYTVYLLPNSLNYRSRSRTLEWLGKRTDLYHYFLPQSSMDSSEPYNLSKKTRDEINDELGEKFNAPQKLAITAIVTGVHGTIPYVLFGPPGTGKTTTLVASVKLILKTNQTARILICAPSNTAADLFTIQLLQSSVSSREILRLYSLSKPVYEQNAAIRNCCFTTTSKEGDIVFGIEPKEELLAKYRVIMCTLSASSYLCTGGLQDCFSHIIVDEAGQALEVDTLIPIVGLAGYNTRVVLAGDPKQLGPIEMCAPLKIFRLNISLLERIVNMRQVYQIDLDERYMCMLEYNYRSHPSLIEVPSNLFYKSLLKVASPEGSKSSLSNWKRLPKKGFPIIWHSTEAEEIIDPNGFSYSNDREAQIVCSYVDMLLKETNVKPVEIGVITPYRFQIKKINSMLTYTGITVDSVERFQGSERRVIIVSTVRNAKIGFLDCAKRFNTTVTRPQELLIIVGNKNLLSKNYGWSRYLEHCRKNNAIVDKIVAKANNVVSESVKYKNTTPKAAITKSEYVDWDSDDSTISSCSASTVLSSQLKQLASDIGEIRLK